MWYRTFLSGLFLIVFFKLVTGSRFPSYFRAALGLPWGPISPSNSEASSRWLSVNLGSGRI